MLEFTVERCKPCGETQAESEKKMYIENKKIKLVCVHLSIILLS